MAEELLIGPAAELPKGQMRQFDANGEPVLICNIGGEYFALEGTCPHRGAMLAQGKMADGVVVCPWHEWQFELRTGQGISNPMACLRRFSIELRDGMLYFQS